jgi:hypothetical protein
MLFSKSNDKKSVAPPHTAAVNLQGNFTFDDEVRRAVCVQARLHRVVLCVCVRVCVCVCLCVCVCVCLCVCVCVCKLIDIDSN